MNDYERKKINYQKNSMALLKFSPLKLLLELSQPSLWL